MPDQLRSMEVFVKVLATGSFSAAGRSLRLSQTMVTKHIAALEERIGAQLLRRTTQRVTPTEAGLRFGEACERILEEVREAEAMAASDRVEPRGTLRMSAPLSFGLRELTGLMPHYLRQNSQVTLDLDLNDRLVDIMDEGFDMAVRIGRLKESSLKARKLAPCHLLLCAAPAYLAEFGTPRRISDLSEHNCLGYTLSSTLGSGEWFFGQDGEVPVRISGNFRASSGDAVTTAAVQGLGIVYEPTFIVGDAIRSGHLQVIELEAKPAQLSGVYAVWPDTRHPSAKIRSMINYLVECWGSAPPWDRHLPTPLV
ncbi:LysR family transcriptional regulator [Aureimonas fodinaquatilis]|uniref:LysR family transcriptional regulator n=1 Tax=Aureimonas fodinaquatilis TaxID=2565783 RepID=A0A5B0E198_9HYPH|nr:LysR family transcriptional regulator [Aureimonas fodinaquatilis]KAA0972082.1 LysR family transcriptional regulator [Aureimonas fodinaquatilis]